MAIKLNLDAFLELGEKIHAKLGEYENHLSRISAYLQSYQRGVHNNDTETVTLNASGFGVMDFGQPPVGFFWIIRLITVSDAAAWSNSMGAAAVQFGVGNPDAAGSSAVLPTPYVRWPFATLPNAATFSTNQFTTTAMSDHVIAQVVGGNAGQVIQATIVYEQWPLRHMPKEF